ncbi:MAG: alpha/beta hydrolase [Pseudomonadota bacterium]
MPPELKPAFEAEQVYFTLPRGGRVACYKKTGTGRPLLLLHSINAAPSAFEVSPFFLQMKLEQPLYAADLPGFGLSSRADRAYTASFYAQSIVDLCQIIDDGPIDVLALSTTCELVAQAVKLAPYLFNKLVLVSPTGFSRRKVRSGSGSGALNVLRTPLLGEALFRALRSRTSINYFLNMAFKDGAPKLMIDYAYATAAQPGARYAPFYFLSGQLFAGDAIGELYSHLPQQVLVIYDKDPNVSLRLLDEFAAERENWTACRVADTRGLPHFEKPEETEEVLKRFL